MRKFCFLFFCFFLTKISFGQIEIGIKSGANIATTRDLIAFPKNRLGWFAGIGSCIPFQKDFFLQTELIYSSKGHKSNSQLGSSRSSLRLNYLNLPILVGYNFDKKTSIVLGPEFGYLLGARLLIDKENNLDFTKQYPPKFDVGVSVGLQYRIVENTGIAIRYNYGFNTLYSVDAVGTRYSEENGANRVFQVGMNYLFHK